MRKGCKEVYVAGEMTGWKPTLKLSKVNDETWQIAAKVKCLTQYKFFVDGEWFLDDSKPKVDDGHGNMNNIISNY